MQGITIAIVADDADMRQQMRDGLSANGYAVIDYDYRMSTNHGGIKGAYIACLGVKDEVGLQMLQRWRERDPGLPVVVYGTDTVAKRAMGNGAYDVVPAESPAERLVRTVEHAIEKRQLVEAVERLRSELTVRDHGDGDFVVPLRELEHRAIGRALQAAHGSVTKAAKLLGIGRATLYRRLASPEFASLRPRRSAEFTVHAQA